ncbi:MAG: hypothetical protein Q4G33_01095 [bacterium]|nr:hypothetical protein [bacterium]
MKRIFENPEISVDRFLTENIITTSGTYAQKVKNTMGVDEKN